MNELKTILEQLDYPVAYDHFNTPTVPPFIVFRRYASNNFFADGGVYKKINNIYVELYTDKKDIEIENALEKLFDENQIVYNVESETFISEENVYEIIYEINKED
ncbi:MAG: hypothetical protein IJX99_02165 [Clostridia bacterium]|nr:hypothetical protein [Clostridia bacterium]